MTLKFWMTSISRLDIAVTAVPMSAKPRSSTVSRFVAPPHQASLREYLATNVVGSKLSSFQAPVPSGRSLSVVPEV